MLKVGIDIIFIDEKFLWWYISKIIYLTIFDLTIKVLSMKLWSAFFVSILMMMPVAQVNAKNYPCSKSMGGVSHCKDGKFVCNNGKISQSKKVCKG